ncbi:carboxylic ester hydrolase [Parastagonospora nodorum]|uniref:Carboxylic ester hydrolase n=2 Tax=Phaeosphaeria nodorum (strain SN15 / ATCC MYA-4574 / FGSC 10173) TaxID=321614 RepID=A0A7U2F1A6_PHANO|nr:hypothetical protein SNOG_01642 [Parastagonospora nodorum SN15]KAH3915035.1 carboxylic ester hydrolase [Parastagonospora nodorum]EAT91291.1 hypothetical protein SNOG_01642 [Parastagonospora nodorum SN15]KAH3929949.1 carboxylic ester hydrolase [Parastagonospora nodorum]KAH3955607.1 carboxylic ester hydrolase [Parastagonospora nodorum]KAH3982301.1 carboxylic ester hydrolase [Parastagonospora nodorum]
MRVFRSVVAGALIAGVSVAAEPIPSIAARDTPTVDLGYGVYSGSYDATNNINAFKGVRYAAPPLGKLRWAAPQVPAKNRTSTITALKDPPACPQTGAGSATPAEYGFTSALGNEDCLFLNVFAPANATNLPVFFWIHGGGHNLFSITGLDPTEIMKQNKNGFVSVIIQYRLGAFGFLGGEDVAEAGALNAGLLDQNFALKWVQANIAKFGGDPSKVTIAGESSGAASVLYQAMAYGGQQKENLFNNVITASPWFPEQYCYDDDEIEDRYEAFAELAGCSKANDTLACLRSQNTTTLQTASQKVGESRPFGAFAFLPVTDGSFIKDRPSKQLLSAAVKGKRVLSGNMANEGIPLAPPTAKTPQDFRSYLDTTFPLFSSVDKSAVERTYSYAGDSSPIDPNAPLYATNGISGATAVNQSAYGTGQTQRLINVFAEYAFDCPSYWAASAFSQGWKYQFSAPPAYHGYDLQALWSGTRTPGASFKHVFRAIWGNFIINNTPVISVQDAKGGVANSSVSNIDGAMVKWPQWDAGMPYLLNLNATGGVPSPVAAGPYLKYNVYSDPGVSNVISLADAQAWEGGRGARCEFWKSVAAKVPY